MCGCPFFDSLFLALFFFFYLNLELNLFLHVVVVGDNIPLALFHYSETTEIFFQAQSIDAVPSYLFDAELDDETIGRALSSSLFIQEREEPADRRQAYHSFEESLLPAQSFSVCHARTERPVHELCSLSSRSREKPGRDSENERIRILLERQKELIFAALRAEIHKHERVPSRFW